MVLVDDAGAPVAAHVTARPGGRGRRRPAGRRDGSGAADRDGRGPRGRLQPCASQARAADPRAPDAGECPRQVEARLFKGSYKGVTDLVTKYVWPTPARIVTRWCARRRDHAQPGDHRWACCWSCRLVLFWTGPFRLGPGLRLDHDLPRHRRRQAGAGDADFLDDRQHLRPRHRPDPSAVLVVGLDGRRAGRAASACPTWPSSCGSCSAATVLQRGLEGIFMRRFKLHVHAWRPFDSFFRLITARRNPNLLLLTGACLFGRPDDRLAAGGGLDGDQPRRPRRPDPAGRDDAARRDGVLAVAADARRRHPQPAEPRATAAKAR